MEFVCVSNFNALNLFASVLKINAFQAKYFKGATTSLMLEF